jgi:hypothetical protein
MSSDRAQDTLKSLDYLHRGRRLGNGWSCSPKAQHEGSDRCGTKGCGHELFLDDSLEHDVGVAVIPATSHRLQRPAERNWMAPGASRHSTDPVSPQ